MSSNSALEVRVHSLPNIGDLLFFKHVAKSIKVEVKGGMYREILLVIREKNMQVHTFVKTLLFSCSVFQMSWINILISNTLFSLTSFPRRNSVDIFSSTCKFLLEKALISVYGFSLMGVLSALIDLAFPGRKHLHLLVTHWNLLDQANPLSHKGSLWIRGISIRDMKKDCEVKQQFCRFSVSWWSLPIAAALESVLFISRPYLGQHHPVLCQFYTAPVSLWELPLHITHSCCNQELTSLLQGMDYVSKNSFL